MATWQGTNGGLLAGIGGVNSNAPSVNDIGNTLQLIRQNNDIERSGANNVGLTALQGLSGIAGVFQQEKQAQRQKEFQQAYANAYASGDRGALRQLATQYPDQIESVRKGMGFIDEEQRNSIGTLAAGARLAASSPEAMQSWLQNNAKELARVGVDLTTLLRCISRILQDLVSLLITSEWLLLVRLITSMFRTRWLVVRLTEADWQRQSAAIRLEKHFRREGKTFPISQQ